MSDKSIHYRETRYGFEYGAATVSRACSHNGYVIVRVASLKTGKFVDIQLSPAGKNLYVQTGEYKDPADARLE